MSDAPKMIWAKPNYDGEFDGMFVIDGYPLPPSMDSGAFKYVRADEHDRLMAEKDAEIEALQALVLELERERDTWHADANLMLGFADLAYEVGAAPTSGELISAKHRAVASIRTAALEEAARVAEMHFERLPNYAKHAGNHLADKVEEGYGNAVTNIAAAIRALKDRNETEPEREPDNRTDNPDNRLDGEREET